MTLLDRYKVRSFTLGIGVAASLLILGCDSTSSGPDVEKEEAAAVEENSPKAEAADVGAADDGAEDPLRVLHADCEATMEQCSSLTCSADDGACGAAHDACDNKLAGMCELVEADTEADLGPCEGTRCEFMKAVHACFKAGMGCDDPISGPGDDCKLKALGKLPACIAQAMKDHGGCDGGSCPGSGCDDCEEVKAPGDGCLLKPGDDCPAGGCLLGWVKSMTGGQGGCLLGWLKKAGQGCPDCG